MPILVIVLILILLLLLIGFIRSWQVQSYQQQKEFLKGKLPQKLDGLYHGSVGNHKVTWLGKSFKDSIGINNFQDGSKVVQKYPFKTYTGKGLQDSNLEVLKIDYNLKQNPLWVRFILDEVVEVNEGKLLGKVHLKIIPGISFALGYFNLKK